jgi:hypothetical protein
VTQSGQGDEPSARPAREGIVLPSDGGEPLLPGMTGANAAQQDAGGHTPPAIPSGGQSWGAGGGYPESSGGQAWPEAGAQAWHEPEQSAPSHGAGWDSAPQPSGGAGPLPPENAPAPGHGTPFTGYQQQDGGYQQQYDPYAGQGGQGTHGGYDAQQPGSHAADGYAANGYGQAGNGGADEGATQYLPPVPGGGHGEAATQYIPPVASGAMPPELSHEPGHYPGQAAQGRPPQGQAGPPYGGAPAPASGSDAEATQFMAPVAAHDGGPYGGQGDAGRQGMGQGDPEDRTPPAEFDNLFRTDSGAESPGSTQQFPRYQQGAQDRGGYQQAPAAPYGGGPAGGGSQGGGGDQWGTPDAGPAPRRRSGSRVPLIAAVGIGIVVLGVGAGALLSGGGGDDDKAGGQTASPSAPATQDSASASADPAKAQAVALDQLLSESGNSRASVIKAAGEVKACTNLANAATDLRDASQQRKDLVTKLSQLAVDQLPDHAALTAALNSAWQASASADSHYAAWADQTAGKNGCKKGQARTTGQTAAGNRASGTASTQKAKASELWNTIAETYGLTQRQPTQL